MKRRPYPKRYKGLVPYGKARWSMFSGWARDVASIAKRGGMTALDAMEQRAHMQRRFRRKAA